MASLFSAKEISRVLIVAPLSVIATWHNEFSKWFPQIPVFKTHGMKKTEKKYKIASFLLKPGVCLANYDSIRADEASYSTVYGKKIEWDYIILDEGHKIKDNKSATFQALKSLKAQKKLLLTGTALQNNIKELWVLFSFIFDEHLLGPYSQFYRTYELPIVKSRTKGASGREIRLGKEIAASLKKVIGPYYLRRTKAELKQQGDTNILSGVRKNDIVCWVFINRFQEQLYRNFLETESVQNVLSKASSGLVALNVLKKICDHPRLLNTNRMEEINLDGSETDSMSWIRKMQQYVSDYQKFNASAETLIAESGKLEFLDQLCKLLHANGNRTLIFSRSTKVLDMIETVLNAQGFKFLRMDGSVSSIAERENILLNFTSNMMYRFLLLTTQVGGVGLTITSADRVIICNFKFFYVA